MPAQALGSIIYENVNGHYYLPVLVGIITLYIIRAKVYGKKTDRERDLHGRTVLLTGATTALGITLVTELAKRGAQVIAVVPDLSDPASLSLIDLVRHTTKNELVYAEECNLKSPNSIKDFCARLVKSSGGGLETEPPRLDAIIFAHEYLHIGAWRGSNAEKSFEQRRRLEGRLATFFFTTLLLPILLTAPQERDIRFINLVSPFYAAAIPSFHPTPTTSSSSSSSSIWIEEGQRSLETILFTRHFQRVLDALPSPSIQTQMSTSSSNRNDPEVVAAKRPLNISSVVVSPGISRWDTLAPFMRADRASEGFSALGLLCYIVALPFFYLFAKSSEASIQTVLHALFLPSVIKIKMESGKLSQTSSRDEYLRPGVLYAECESRSLPGDAEKRFGGEEAGQQIWENLEQSLAQWRKSEAQGTDEGSREPKI